MEELKNIFGESALTYEQFTAKLEAADKKTLNLANLAKGGYVAKDKFTNKETELATAQNTIRELQDAAKKWDGVDVDKLKNDMAALQTKYDNDVAAIKLDSAVNVALLEAKVKNPKLARAGLDMSLVKLDGDKLLGLSEQLEALKKSDGYLFDEADGGDVSPRVKTGGNHNNNNNTDAFMSAFMKGAGMEPGKE